MKISVTIITVAFNAEKYIEATIKSIVALRENRPDVNVDYIIVDGASADKTSEIISLYIDHVTKWISEPDQGIYDAMNKGWAMADIDSYILFLGAGDTISDLPLEREYCNNLALIGKVSIGNSGVFVSSASSKIKFVNTLHHQALLLHKSVSFEPPFNTKYKLLGDYDFNARLYKEGVNFVFSNSFTSYALPGGISSKDCSAEKIDIVFRNFGRSWQLMVIAYHLGVKRLISPFNINIKQIIGLMQLPK
jgi:glycosyltransferase involved in cell wall biosynthesis